VPPQDPVDRTIVDASAVGVELLGPLRVLRVEVVRGPLDPDDAGADVARKRVHPRPVLGVAHRPGLTLVQLDGHLVDLAIEFVVSLRVRLGDRSRLIDAHIGCLVCGEDEGRSSIDSPLGDLLTVDEDRSRAA